MKVNKKKVSACKQEISDFNGSVKNQMTPEEFIELKH